MPIVVRMIGNIEKSGHQILQEIGIEPFLELEEPVDLVVALSKEIN